MTINALWNRRYGPGGGTRRLHHYKGFAVLLAASGMGPK